MKQCVSRFLISSLALSLLMPSALLAAPAKKNQPISQHQTVATKDYAPLVYDKATDSFVGWVKMNDNEWAADPADPASPHVFIMQNKTANQLPKLAFDTAVKHYALKNVVNYSADEIKTWKTLSQTNSRAWVSAGETKVNGVAQSLFAVTLYDKDKNQYETQFFMIPTQLYQKSGGVKSMLDAYQLTKHIPGLPDNFTEIVRGATPKQQTMVFSRLFDLTVNNLTMGVMDAQSGVLSSLQGIGKDLNTRTECIQTPNCSYVMGALPGQATMSITP